MSEYERVEAGERKLTDIISGYLNPMEHVPSALAQQQAAEALKLENGDTEEEDEEEEEQHEGGLDPEVAFERFDAIRKQLKKTENAFLAMVATAIPARKTLLIWQTCLSTSS